MEPDDASLSAMATNSWNTDEYYYCSTNSTQWKTCWSVDIGAVRKVRLLLVHWDVWLDPLKTQPNQEDVVKIEYSKDGNNWTELVALHSRQETSRCYDNMCGRWYHYVTDTELRYVRALAKTSNQNNTIHAAFYKLLII